MEPEEPPCIFLFPKLCIFSFLWCVVKMKYDSGAVFLPACVIFFNTLIEMLGTLSLDDKSVFLGGHKVAPNAT